MPVTGLHFVTSVSAGKRFSLALLADGSVQGVGQQRLRPARRRKQHHEPRAGRSDRPERGQIDLRRRTAFALALLATGEVESWGENESGQLGTGDTSERTVPVAVKRLKNVKSVSAGADHSLALLSNGTVMAWGNNELGQLGTGNTKSSNVPVAVKGLSGVTAVAAGGNFSLALLSNGTVKAWGSDENGQLGVPPPEEGFSDVPLQVTSLSGITAVVGGGQPRARADLLRHRDGVGRRQPRRARRRHVRKRVQGNPCPSERAHRRAGDLRRQPGQRRAARQRHA